MKSCETSLSSFQSSQHLCIPNGMEHLFTVELFIDLSNVECGLCDIGYNKIDYGKLVDVVVREYAHRLNMASVRCPSAQWQLDVLRLSGVATAFCKAIWCVASVPVNFNPEDIVLAKKRRAFLKALRLRHGFHVEERSIDFAGNHISKEARKKSSNKRERMWERKEKGVDMALGVRLMERCLSDDPPGGIIVVSGDADFAPALEAAVRHCPGIQVMVAAFSKKLSDTYRLDSGLGYNWQWPAIVLDAFMTELNVEH